MDPSRRRASRSEAAALFIKEGLNLRSEELKNCAHPSIDKVAQAKRELHEKA